MISVLKKLSLSPLPVPADWYAIPLRLIAGYGFFAHGWAKLARGPQNFAGILNDMGMTLGTTGMAVPTALSWSTVMIEIVGGLMILAGALVPLATIPMIVVLLVAIFTAHLPNGFSSIKLISYDAAGAHFGQPGYETDLLYIACLVALCLGGAGPFSVDKYLARRCK